MAAQIRILQATLVIFLPHLFLKSLQLAACLPCIFPRWLWFIASPWIHVLSHCLLSLPTVFMYCLPHLLYWLAQALSENSRHLCIYLRFTYPSVSSCSIQTFCRNPPSIYATSLVSDFSFSSESMGLLLVPKVRLQSKRVGVHQVLFCGIQEAGRPPCQPCHSSLFSCWTGSSETTEKRGSKIVWKGIKLILCFYILFGPDIPGG